MKTDEGLILTQAKPREVATLLDDGSVTLVGFTAGGEVVSTVTNEHGYLEAVEVHGCSVEAASKLAQLLDVEVRVARRG